MSRPNVVPKTTARRNFRRRILRIVRRTTPATMLPKYSDYGDKIATDSAEPFRSAIVEVSSAGRVVFATEKKRTGVVYPDRIEKRRGRGNIDRTRRDEQQRPRRGYFFTFIERPHRRRTGCGPAANRRAVWYFGRPVSRHFIPRERLRRAGRERPSDSSHGRRLRCGDHKPGAAQSPTRVRDLATNGLNRRKR